MNHRVSVRPAKSISIWRHSNPLLSLPLLGY
jgi:hypothetical protein